MASHPSTLGASRYWGDRQIDVPADSYGQYGEMQMDGDFRDQSRAQFYDQLHAPSTYDDDHSREYGSYMLQDGNFVNPNTSWRDHDGRPPIAAAQSNKRYTQLFNGGSVVGEVKRDQTHVVPLSGEETGLVFSVEEDFSRRKDQRLKDRFTAGLQSQARYQKERAAPDNSLTESDEMRTGFMNRPYNFNGGLDGRDFQTQTRHEANPLGKWHDVRDRVANVNRRLRIGADGEVQYARDSRASNVINGQLGMNVDGAGNRISDRRTESTKEISLTAGDAILSTNNAIYPIEAPLNSQQQKLLDMHKPDTRLTDLFRGVHLATMPSSLPIHMKYIPNDTRKYDESKTKDKDDRAQLMRFKSMMEKFAGDRPMTDTDTQKLAERLKEAQNRIYQHVITGDRLSRPMDSDIHATEERLARDLSAALLKAASERPLDQQYNDMHANEDEARRLKIRSVANMKDFECSVRDVISAMNKNDERKSTPKAVAHINKKTTNQDSPTENDTAALRERKVRDLSAALLKTPGAIPMLGVNEMHAYESRLARMEGAPDLPIAQEVIFTRDIAGESDPQKIEAQHRAAKFGVAPMRADIMQQSHETDRTNETMVRGRR